MKAKQQTAPSQPTRLFLQQWQAEGVRRFGADRMQWRFVCPACGVVTTAKEWVDAGAPEGAIAFSCIGRWAGHRREAFAVRDDKKPGPCNYAGGGLFRINPVHVVLPDGGVKDVFAFAE